MDSRALGMVKEFKPVSVQEGQDIPVTHYAQVQAEEGHHKDCIPPDGSAQPPPHSPQPWVRQPCLSLLLLAAVFQVPMATSSSAPGRRAEKGREEGGRERSMGYGGRGRQTAGVSSTKEMPKGPGLVSCRQMYSGLLLEGRTPEHHRHTPPPTWRSLTRTPSDLAGSNHC